MTIPGLKTNIFTVCGEGNTVRQRPLLVTKSFCVRFNVGYTGSTSSVSPAGILTLQEVGDQQSSCVVTAGQSLLCQVPLDLQCKQVPGGEEQGVELQRPS